MPNNPSYLALRHALDIARLPPPDEEFEFKEVDLSWSQHKLFIQNDVLLKASRPGTMDDDLHTWRVNPEVWEIVQDYAENTETFECCGSRSVRNVDGELRCKHCDEPIDRETFKQVM